MLHPSLAKAALAALAFSAIVAVAPSARAQYDDYGGGYEQEPGYYKPHYRRSYQNCYYRYRRVYNEYTHSYRRVRVRICD